MIRALYTAASGMSAQQLNLDTIANNLANSSTTGFRQLRLNFEDMVYQNLVTPGAAQSQSTVSAGLQIGLGTKSAETEVLQTQGPLNQTSNTYDVAISGSGFFQVQRPDGSIAYSRAGQFQLNNQGTITTTDGDPIIPTITIPANATAVTITQYGVVNATLPGQQNPSQLGQIQLATFPNPGGLEPRSARATRCWATPAGPKGWGRCNRATWKTPMWTSSPCSCRWCWRNGPTNRTPRSSRPPTTCTRRPIIWLTPEGGSGWVV
jgi:flagellar basal-body rod protein FlgG